MRIGVYGGTFNPIHNGHVNIVTQFYKRLKLEKVLVIPTHVPPHKIADRLADSSDRMKMCRLALQNTHMNFEISDMEIKRDKKSYTADTLRELKKIYPDDEFFLLMGEDMFMTVQDWVRPEEIFEDAVICGTPRSPDGIEGLEIHGCRLQQQYKNFRFIVENIPYINVSSTEIRDCAGNKERLKDLVPEAVAEYICSKHMY